MPWFAVIGEQAFGDLGLPFDVVGDGLSTAVSAPPPLQLPDADGVVACLSSSNLEAIVSSRERSSRQENTRRAPAA
jgi:hypothetical protein